MISVRRVSKAFGRIHAVEDVSFEIPRGQVVGMLGANGAGKSTTIRMITGFLPPDRGEVLVDGHDTIADSLAARQAIGYLPESAPSYPEMAVEDFLIFRARLYGVARSKRRARLDFVLARCELVDMRRRRIGQLSKGYRQRVGLAAALIHDPPVLILDEPTNALDPRQIRLTRTLVRELAIDKAVLVSSHVLPEVEQTCDRVVIMARGRIRADARPGDLLAHVRADAPYIAHIRGDEDSAMVSVLSIPGIAKVQRDQPTPGRLPPPPGATAILITPKPSTPDLREPISMALSAAGHPIIELRREAPGLERLFLELIESEGGDGAMKPPADARAESAA
jgi:ABC-2 type transport system ATP-binding protein